MVALRYATDPITPWRGSSPLRTNAGGALGVLSGAVEHRLGQEVAGLPPGVILPVPSFGEDLEVELATELAKGGGKLRLLPTTSGGSRDGRGSAPSADWTPRHIHASPAETMVALRDSVRRDVLLAFGVLPSLSGEAGGGSAAREAARLLLLNTLSPIARLIEHEVGRVLEQDTTVSMKPLHAGDLTARTRSYKSMVETEIAAQEAGIETQPFRDAVGI